MSTVIGIMGQSGHGKTTAMRTLDPTSTFYIDADRKGLSWRGWRAQYKNRSTSRVPGGPGNNYLASSDPAMIESDMRAAAKNPLVKTIVVDTLNAVMIDQEMGRIKEKGYDKWVDLAQSVFDIVTLAGQLRHDIIVVLCFHVQSQLDDDGVRCDSILTNGRKLEKIHLEYKLPLLLYVKCKQKPESNEYVFEVQARGSTAKSPLGMFDGMEIPNDMAMVCDAVRAYQDGDEIENTHQTNTVPAETAVKAEPARDAGSEPRQPQRAIPAAGGDLEKLVTLMAEASIPVGVMCKYLADPKRACLVPGDLELTHIPPDKLAQIVNPDNWERIVERIGIIMDSHPEQAPAFNPQDDVRRLMELSGVSDAGLNAYCKAKSETLPGLRMPWYESDMDMLDKIATDPVWEKVSAWVKANG